LALHSAAPRIAAQYQSYDTLFAKGEDCTHWVYLDGNGYCSPDFSKADREIKAETRSTLRQASARPELTLYSVPLHFSFDRTLGNVDLPASVLYTDLTDKSFGHFHTTLLRTAKEGKSSYTVRYRPSSDRNAKDELFVSGYGVEMALKKTDYIVIDDREAPLQDSVADKAAGSTIELESEEEISDLKPLSVSELRRLGVKAASFVLSSHDPLDTLVKLSQDFPKYSTAMSSHNVSEAFSTELGENRDAYLQPGINQLWINGIEIEERHVDAFALLENLRKERKLVKSLSAIGMTGPEAIRLLSHPLIKESMFKDEPQRYDWRDDLDGGGVIIWLNDIEKDSRYKEWNSGLGAVRTR
jgi:UDP-glucose:glycoprotein glucosyltransferase